MKFFEGFFRRRPSGTKWAMTLDGLAPIYTQYGTNVYASDAVQSALKCIVDEMKKLRPMHVRTKPGQDPAPVESDLQKVLNDPNPLMTTSEFIEKVVWLWLLNYNAFIVPVYDVWIDAKTGEERRKYKALYPIQPTNVDFIEDASGRLFVSFRFPNGYETTLRYDDVIHLRMNYSVSMYMGGNEMGQPNNDALLQTLRLNDEILKGIAKAMKASYSVNGVVKYNSLLDDGKMEKALKELETKLQKSESGFLPIDLKAEFTPFEHKSELVDAETLKFIDEKILRFWGVSLPILTGDFTKAQFEAFYQKCLEPKVIELSQAFTKKLFTTREKSFGNEVKFYPKDLIFMTVDETLRMIEILAPTGALFENEKRAALGLRPIPELEGVRYMSLNWINSDDARQYQTGKVNIDVVDETKEGV